MSAQPPTPAAAGEDHRFYLLDFCEARAVLAVVLIAALLALVLALDNIRQRLEFAYPGRSSVEVDDAGDTYRARLRFPLVLGETSGPP